MTLLKCEVEAGRLAGRWPPDQVPVLLYATNAPPGVGTVGASLVTMMERLSIPPSSTCVDLVSIAMAVTAADTFVLREHAADGWRRVLHVDVPVNRPNLWAPLAPHLSRLLGFLSGDDWDFTFKPDGLPPPLKSDVRRRDPVSNPSRSDCIALFSGGLDSALGVTELIQNGWHPLLVSHAATGDAMFQNLVAPKLPARMQRFSFNAYPSRDGENDVTMRTRSFQFIAAAALAAQTLHAFRGGDPITVHMCENGLIALNPPLTARRIGSHSTRTAHPHYLAMFQEMLDAVGIPVSLINKHRHDTKGEMLLRHAGDAGISAFASSTVSCGKWKRKNIQCGRCLPCMIRRASFHYAGVTDVTPYETAQIRSALLSESRREDVLSVHVALKRRYERNIKSWVLQSGPLPLVEPERAAHFAVAERGMDELEAFFASQGLPV